MPLHDTSYPFEVRCLHLDYDEPPLARDIGREFHRRCTAIFPYAPEDLPDDRRHLAAFCLLHRVRYAGDDTPATPEEVRQAMAKLHQFARRVAMPEAAREPEKPAEPTPEEVRVAAERRRRLIADAQAHGLFDPEAR